MELTVHYDFASTLCYVAHRLMQEMAEDLRELGLALRWSPVDLSQITGWPRGAEIPEARRRNAARAAEELSVTVRVPRRWPDSRLADASAVQFTRNPDGIAGALKMIAVSAEGSVVNAPEAEETSHMFFGSMYPVTHFNIFATHPPLLKRIQKLDSRFEGDFDEYRRQRDARRCSRS